VRRYLLLGPVLALIVSACAGGEVRLGPPVDCDTKSKGRLLLIAQAVPGAGMIPCLGELPRDWEVSNVDTKSGEAMLELRNDVLNTSAELTLTTECTAPAPSSSDLTFVASGSSDDEGGTFLFEGGCLIVEMPADERLDDPGRVLEAIQFLTRDELRDRSGWEL
jgi:hypothetical protein